MLNWSLLMLSLMTALCCRGAAESLPAASGLIPEPVQVHFSEGYFEITPDTVITADQKTAQLGRQLAQMLSPAMGYRLKVCEDILLENGIALKLNPSLKDRGREAYKLTVSSNQIRIEAFDKPGIYYGLITLTQLLPIEIFSPQKQENIVWKVPAVEIEDCPRFPWRGMHLDVARHFMPTAFVKKYLDVMALHKINVFHWHLTDDQGWRIEIKKYPRLTEVGAWRKKSSACNEQVYGDFYSQQEIREIVDYAKERFITIVPEIEMPGHCQAAIAAYPELGNSEQQLDVPAQWGRGQDVFNVEESTILFLQDVLTEVLELFPGELIHIGGDEVQKDPWKNSSKVQTRMEELGLKNEEQLQQWFIGRMDTFLSQKGRKVMVWDEAFHTNLSSRAVISAWRKRKEIGVLAAKAGYDVVMGENSHTYFNFYQADPNTEPPAPENKFIPLEKVYSYDPIPKGLSNVQARHILGVQGQLWTEFIPDTKLAEYMAYPRACALAEVAWTDAAKRDYDDFYKRLRTHLKRLEMLGVNFRKLD